MRRIAAVTIGAAALLGAFAAPVQAAPSDIGAVVSLGDSFISGEAGRWQSNGSVQFNGRLTTPGCHRSDVAEIQLSEAYGLTTNAKFACSGATTTDG